MKSHPHAELRRQMCPDCKQTVDLCAVGTTLVLREHNQPLEKGEREQVRCAGSGKAASVA